MRGFLKTLLSGGVKDKAQLRKQWAFIFNSFGISTLILAVLLTFAPYMDTDNPNLADIRALEKTVQRIEPKKVGDLLVSEDGKPVMMVFYASWCSYCAQLLPRIFELMDEKKLEGVKPVFLSIDYQPRVYSKYLYKSQYYKRFNPIMLQEVFYNDLPDVLARHGSTYTGAIPYVGFFDPKGKMVAEIFGLVDKQTLLNAAEKLR